MQIHLHSLATMRAVLVVVSLACLLGLTAATAQICDASKAPGSPWNTLLTGNTYDASTKTASEWLVLLFLLFKTVNTAV